uniref:Putative plant transposon protein domain-containing protein n=1 Tax=Solanum tuberosum TaxID=4113 RepID=M1DIE0_SOLTU
MVGENEENLPFVRFPNAACRERHHNYKKIINFAVREDNPHPSLRIRGFDIPLNATTINEVLELPEVSNMLYEVKLRVMDLGWLRDMLVEHVRRDNVYWPSAESITSADWSPDAKMWLYFVNRRIRTLGNYTDVTFPRSLVVLCAA